MNPILQYYQQNIHHIKYKNYIINNKKNIIVLNILYKLLTFAQEKKLSCFLSGSLSSMFQFKKIYRTIKDVDLIIKKEELPEWVNLLLTIDSGYFLFFYEKTLEEAIDNWMKSETNPIKRVISFKNKNKNTCSVDFIHFDNNIGHLKQEIKIENLTINYLPSIKLIKKLEPTHRPIDYEDMRFLLQFEDAKKFLLNVPINNCK